MTPAFPVTCSSSANSIRTLQTFTCNSCYCNYYNAKRGLPESAGCSNIVLNSRVSSSSSSIQIHHRLGPRIRAVDDSSANESDDNLRRKKSGLFLKAKLLYDHIRKLVKQFLQQHAVPVALSTAAGALFCICYLTSQLAQAIPSPVLVPYSELVKNLNSGTVSSVLFEEGSRRIFFNNNNSATESKPAAAAEESEKKSFRNSRFVRVLNSRSLLDNVGSSVKWGYCTRRVENDETYLLGLMRDCGVTYSSAPQPLSASMTKILVTVLTVWIPLMPFMWLLHKQISANNSSVQRRSSRQQAVKFDDVAGVDAAKAELMEIVSCLQGAINYKKLGANLPKGVLLVGPPGTGKTLLARAVAGEAGVPFYASSASEFVELFVGRGAARIRDLFKVARKCTPSIIFIDELDAVGGRRGKSFNDERDQTLNQLLTEMDGFESNNGVLVIAATNRPEALDPAICRPGRFSRRVFVKEPDFDGRKRILAIYLRGIPCEEDPELLCNILASATSGFVGADLANVVNEAALLAARQGKDVVSLDCLKEAVHRARFGVGNNVGSTDFRKEIGKLFPWIQLKSSSDTENRSNELPAGYQTIT